MKMNGTYPNGGFIYYDLNLYLSLSWNVKQRIYQAYNWESVLYKVIEKVCGLYECGYDMRRSVIFILDY